MCSLLFVSAMGLGQLVIAQPILLNALNWGGAILAQAVMFGALFFAAAVPADLVWLVLGALVHRLLRDERSARIFNIIMAMSIARELVVRL